MWARDWPPAESMTEETADDIRVRHTFLVPIPFFFSLNAPDSFYEYIFVSRSALLTQG